MQKSYDGTYLLNFSKSDWLGLVTSIHSPVPHISPIPCGDGPGHWLRQFVKQSHLFCQT